MERVRRSSSQDVAGGDRGVPEEISQLRLLEKEKRELNRLWANWYDVELKKLKLEIRRRKAVGAATVEKESASLIRCFQNSFNCDVLEESCEFDSVLDLDESLNSQGLPEALSLNSIPILHDEFPSMDSGVYLSYDGRDPGPCDPPSVVDQLDQMMRHPTSDNDSRTVDVIEKTLLMEARYPSCDSLPGLKSSGDTPDPNTGDVCPGGEESGNSGQVSVGIWGACGGGHDVKHREVSTVTEASECPGIGRAYDDSSLLDGARPPWSRRGRRASCPTADLVASWRQEMINRLDGPTRSLMTSMDDITQLSQESKAEFDVLDKRVLRLIRSVKDSRQNTAHVAALEALCAQLEERIEEEWWAAHDLTLAPTTRNYIV